MRKVFSIFPILLMSGIMAMASSDVVQMKVVNVNKGTTAKTDTYPQFVYQFVEGVVFRATNATPFVTTGATTPSSANGYWLTSGTYSGAISYVSQNGLWYMFYDGGSSNYISTNLGQRTYGWYMLTNATVAGTNYQPIAGTTTGVVTVAATAVNVGVKVYTEDSGSLPSQTIFSNTNVTLNTYYPIRITAYDTNGVPGTQTNTVKWLLNQDKVTLSASQAWYSNVTVRAYLVITDHP